MDYEKKYKEALEKAKKLYEQGTITESLSYVFPELRESKDERIRRELIEHIKANCESEFVLFQKFSPDAVVAWLEKQREKTQIDDFDAELQESKDERIRKSIIAIINNYVDNSNTFKPKMLAWLEKQGDQNTVLDELEMTLSVSEDGYLRSNIEKLIKELKTKK